MTRPQQTVVAPLPPPPPPSVVVMVLPQRSVAGQLVQWATGGALVGILLGFVVPFFWYGFSVLLGIPVGTFGGVLIGALVLGVRRVRRGARAGAPASGYGAPVSRTPAGRPATWVHLAGVLAAAGVVATVWSSFWLGPGGSFALRGAAVGGVVAAVLAFVGALLSRESVFARVTTFIVAPLLLLISLGVFAITASTGNGDGGGFDEGARPPPAVAPDVPEESQEQLDLRQEQQSRTPGSPGGISSEWDILSLMNGIEDVANRTLAAAVVVDPSITPDTVFPPAALTCPWQQNAIFASTDIWFDTADDAAALGKVRDFWVSIGYEIVVDDPDLVVAHGGEGLIGDQFILRTTWDDELRLEMQTVCRPN